MPTTDERNILKILDEEGGEASEAKIAKCMGLRLDYVRTILGSMGRRNFIDVLASGKVKLAEKGWKALGKSPRLPLGMPSGPPESPEERYKRWIEGKAAQKPKEKKSQEKKDAATLLRGTPWENLSPQEKFKKWTGQ